MLHEEWFSSRLKERADAGLLRSLVPLETPPGPVVRIGGQELINFASNNYLDLAGHRDLAQAAAQSATRWGSGASGSRLLGGDLALHHQTENVLREWKGAAAALLFNGGYAANVGLVSALCDEHTEVFCDRLNHASLVDGIRLSGARLHRYRHCDLNDLDGLMSRYPGRQILLTESVFSMDGDLAPLCELVEIAERHGALVMVDEAHGDGVFGPAGRGLVHALGLEHRVDVVMGTLGKALGCYGACVWSQPVLRDWLVNHARSFVFSTAMPPPVLGSVQAAVRVVETADDRRFHVLALAERLRSGAHVLGLDTLASASPIVPLVIGGNEETLSAAAFLRERGFLAPAVRPPTVPKGTSRLRINLTAGHTETQVDALLAALTEWRRT